jgi:hypothetical protein
MECVARRWLGAVALATMTMTCFVHVAVASNMGFKCNKQIVKGINLVAFPFNTPTKTAADVCAVFGKYTPGALSTTMTVQMYTSNTPPTDSILSFSCNQVTAGFNIRPDVGLGVRIIETGGTLNGIIVGAHIDNSVTITDAGSSPHGTIIYGYPYHTSDFAARDICQEASLSTTPSQSPTLIRYGSAGAVDGAYTCDQTAITGYVLRLCEGVLISGEGNGPKTWIPLHH